jgi:Outer membrane protein beta-barrel domain
MKNVTLIAFLCILSLNIAAQDQNTGSKGLFSGGRFGIYGGYNMARLTGEETEDSDKFLSGFQVGLMFRAFQLSPVTSFWIEPGYSLMGEKYEDSFGDEEYTMTINLSYISIPLMARFQGKSGLYGEVGLQPQFLVGAKVKAEGESEDIKEETNSFDFGIPAGIGYEFNHKIGIGARYYFGFTNIAKDSDENILNQVLTLRVHYRF